jgi:hypothetical protein
MEVDISLTKIFSGDPLHHPEKIDCSAPWMVIFSHGEKFGSSERHHHLSNIQAFSQKNGQDKTSDNL